MSADDFGFWHGPGCPAMCFLLKAKSDHARPDRTSSIQLASPLMAWHLESLTELEEMCSFE